MGDIRGVCVCVRREAGSVFSSMINRFVMCGQVPRFAVRCTIYLGSWGVSGLASLHVLYRLGVFSFPNPQAWSLYFYQGKSHN